MSAYDQMSPRQFAQDFDKKKHAQKMGRPIVDPDELAQKRFDNPDYEPSETEQAYMQGREHGSQQEQETAKSEAEYKKAYRAPKTTTGTGTPGDPKVSTLKPKPAPRQRAPKPPPDPALQMHKAAKKFGSLARMASGRRR